MESSSPESGSWRTEDSRRFPAETTADPGQWPLQYRLKPITGVAKLRATATARDARESIVAQARTIVDAAREPNVELRLRFDIECLHLGSRCEHTMTCALGECVAASEPLPDRDGEPTGRVMQGVGAVFAEACAPEGARSCAQDSDTQPLLCRAGKWEREPVCSGETRCDRSNADTQGTCRGAISECENSSPGTLFCDAEGKMRECIDDRSASVKQCGDNETCKVMGAEVRCECMTGFLPGQHGCTTPSDCQDNGGCDAETVCQITDGVRACTPCPEGFLGDGETGCAPLLSDLVVSPGQLDPPFDPTMHDYRVVVPTFSNRLSITAQSALDARLTINSVDAKLNQPFLADAPTESVTWPVTLVAAKSGVRNDYNLTVEHGQAQQTYLKASNAHAGDGFGLFAAAYGDTVVIGAPFEAGSGPAPDAANSSTNAGAAYVFVRDGASWRQQAYLKAKVVAAGDMFGTSVSIWKDTIAVGAPGNIYGSFVSGAENGAVYIFRRNGDSWEHHQVLTAERVESGDGFGFFVRVREDMIGVGAPLDDEGGARSGAGYLFARRGEMFEAAGRFKAPTPESEARFGCSMDFDGNIVAMSAWAETVDGSTRAGAVYTYERNATGWPFSQRLVAPTAHDWAQFGGSVEVSGSLLVVSAPHASVEVTPDHHGEVHVFSRNGAQYEPTMVMTARRPTVGDRFGHHMSMTSTQLLVGSAVDADSSAGAGAAYLFARADTGFEEAAYLTAASGDAQDRLGYAVALSENLAVVAAPYEDSSSRTIDDGATDNRAMDSGAAYVFR